MSLASAILFSQPLIISACSSPSISFHRHAGSRRLKICWGSGKVKLLRIQSVNRVFGLTLTGYAAYDQIDGKSFVIDGPFLCIYNQIVKIDFDPAKNAKNIRERGLPFALAAEFDWTIAMIVPSSRHSEARFFALGYIENRLRALVFTKSGATGY